MVSHPTFIPTALHWFALVLHRLGPGPGLGLHWFGPRPGPALIGLGPAWVQARIVCCIVFALVLHWRALFFVLVLALVSALIWIGPHWFRIGFALVLYFVRLG